MMSNKNKSYGKEQAEQFADSCRYLGLKILAEEYQQMIGRANKSSSGYYEFISNIVQAEAAAKKQRRIETLIKNSRLPQPLKMLADFDFDFQPGLDRHDLAIDDKLWGNLAQPHENDVEKPDARTGNQGLDPQGNGRSDKVEQNN
jgi:DNA replication protein DnaC